MSILDRLLDTDPVTRMVRETEVQVRKPGVPEEPDLALGKGIICGLLHRAFVAGATFSRELGAEPTTEEVSAAAAEYIKRDTW